MVQFSTLDNLYFPIFQLLYLNHVEWANGEILLMIKIGDTRELIQNAYSQLWTYNMSFYLYHFNGALAYRIIYILGDHFYKYILSL